MKSIVRAAVIVLMGLLASGCAAGGYDAGSLQDRLVAVGVSRSAAKCVVDGMTDKFGADRLGARADASAAEVRAERALVLRCRVRVIPQAPQPAVGTS